MVYFGGHRNSISTQSWSQCLFTHFFLLWRLNLAYLRSLFKKKINNQSFIWLFFQSGFVFFLWLKSDEFSMSGCPVVSSVPEHWSCTDCSQQWAWQLCWLWYRFLLCLSPECVQFMALECVCWMPELFVCKISLGVSVVVMSTVWRYCVHLGWFGSSRLSMCLALLNPWGTWLCWRIVTLLELDYLLPVLPV